MPPPSRGLRPVTAPSRGSAASQASSSSSSTVRLPSALTSGISVGASPPTTLLLMVLSLVVLGLMGMLAMGRLGHHVTQRMRMEEFLETTVGEHPASTARHPGGRAPPHRREAPAATPHRRGGRGGNSAAMEAVATAARSSKLAKNQLPNTTTVDAPVSAPVTTNLTVENVLATLTSVVDLHSATLEQFSHTQAHKDDRLLLPLLLKCVDIIVCFWDPQTFQETFAFVTEIQRRYKSAWKGCPLDQDPTGFVAVEAASALWAPLEGLQPYEEFISNFSKSVSNSPASDLMKAFVESRVGFVLNNYLTKLNSYTAGECRLRQMAAIVDKLFEDEPSPSALLTPPSASTTEGSATAAVMVDVVIAFSLGMGPHVGPKPVSAAPGRIHPGHSNEGLTATVLRMIADNPDLYVYAQWEVGDLLTGFTYNEGTNYVLTYPPFRIPWIPKYGNSTIPYKEHFDDLDLRIMNQDFHALSNLRLQLQRRRGREVKNITATWLSKAYPTPGHYLSTPGVASGFPAWLRKLPQPVRTVYVVCHPDHRRRCKIETRRVLSYSRRHDFEQINVVYAPDMYYPSSWRMFGCDEYAYDHSSTQTWTAHRARFVSTEIRQRFMMLNHRTLVRC